MVHLNSRSSILLILFILSLVGLSANLKKPVRSVVILGNSIVRHPPLPSIGWSNDWGMAASVADSDFVHRLIYFIHQRQPNVTVRYLNIAGWERDYSRYDLTRLDSLRNPDLLLIRLGENVNEQQATEGEFLTRYDQLINYVDKDQKAIRVITDGFWPNQHVNQWIKNYAIQKKYDFITLHDLSNDSTNMALSKFTNEGVGRHPSDKGMASISGRIWAKLRNYF
jgi:hypothetical protein